jgi:hypothetical protein
MTRYGRVLPLSALRLRRGLAAMHTTVQGGEDPWLGRVKVLGEF